MVISHQYKYLFVEIPVTASWAIHRELCDHYGGEPILHKHASYVEFNKEATEEEKKYFVFATVRNPLDIAVSGFFKLKSDHRGSFTNPEDLQAGRVTKRNVKEFQYIQETNVTFHDFFLQSRHRPYDSMISLSDKHIGFVIRYEKLQEDFAKVLTLLNIEQIQPIPVRNKTGMRRPDWQTYYEPDMYQLAAQKYGPFMEKWRYAFPEEWGNVGYRTRDKWYFNFLKTGRRMYMTNIRYSDSRMAKLVHSLRAGIN